MPTATRERIVPISAHVRAFPRRISRPRMEDYRFADPELERYARMAADLDATAMPYAQYSEQAILNSMFGNLAGVVKTTIAAAATAQTSIATGNAATWIAGGRTGSVSGNMDQTPNTTALIWTGTPGTTPNFNTYTAPHSFLLTNSAATALTIASQSIGLAVTAGDFVFVGGGSSAGGSTTAIPSWQLNTVWLGLTTQAVSGATQANVLSGEPTSTGSYARIAVVNNQANLPIATAASPSVLTSGAAFSFPASTSSGWSTGATNLVQLFIADAPTLAGGNVLAFGALGTPQAVAAAGITLQVTSGGLTVTLT
jgi:hypothetical protein